MLTLMEFLVELRGIEPLSHELRPRKKLFMCNPNFATAPNGYLCESSYFGAESGNCPLPFLWWRMYRY